MTDWSLPQLLAGLHDDIERRLATARKAFGHPGTKGDASESVWLQLFQTYLPQRYQAASAHVVDSKGTFSDQIDVVLFDRQYSPFIFHYEGQTIVPAESIYAVIEAKQAINAGQIDYAQKKVASVRRLHRTSLPYRTPAAPIHQNPYLPSSAAFSHLKATGIRRSGNHCPTRSQAAIRTVDWTLAALPRTECSAVTPTVVTPSCLPASLRPHFYLN